MRATQHRADHTGHAMGSTLQIIVTGPPEQMSVILDWAVARVDELEGKWSRFRRDSDISRINRSPGRAVAVSDETLLLVGRALEARTLSGGRFDPLLLRAITSSGYDISFTSLVDRPPSRPLRAPLVDAGEVRVDPGARTVRVTGSVGIDPGGIGKGLAADLVAQEIVDRGAAGALVNLGGDLRCVGQAPESGGWVVEIGDTAADVAPRTVVLGSGGVASSTSRRRRWMRHGADRPVEAHHLLDPTTRTCSATAARLVSVIAATAADAEWIATSIAAAGALPADRSMLGSSAVLVTGADGCTTSHGPIDPYLR